MGSTLGTNFRITTFGESHGKGIGVVIDGCPSGLVITEELIGTELAKRAPGSTEFVSSRKEPDLPQILSGTYENKTTGAPLCIWIANQDADSSVYDEIKDLIRPGHANYSYHKKYNHFDHRGGGRASARETAARVAAGAVAKAILAEHSCRVVAYLKQVGSIETDPSDEQIIQMDSPIFCPDPNKEAQIQELLTDCFENKDSVGALVEVRVYHPPAGLGEPIFDKLEALCAHAALSIPGVKGFEIGMGFGCVDKQGSQSREEIVSIDPYTTKENLSGGILGGISTGETMVMRVAFKPTSSWQQSQSTFDFEGNLRTLELSSRARHDPCIGIRGVPVVESMISLVLVDALFTQIPLSTQHHLV